jgi:hypothetical protein
MAIIPVSPIFVIISSAGYFSRKEVILCSSYFFQILPDLCSSTQWKEVLRLALNSPFGTI